MLNFNRADRLAEPKDTGKTPLKPALYEPPAASAAGSSANPAMPPSRNIPSAPPAPREQPARGVPEAAAAPQPAAAQPTAPVAAPVTLGTDEGGSRLTVGVNIKLKGVEISDCDALVIEGLVEATVNSKTMSIERPGSFSGTALIDVAEIHGEFTGELTARTRLVVHGTGRVRGTIRYGQLVVEEGGELSGDVKRLEEAPAPSREQRAPQHA